MPTQTSLTYLGNPDEPSFAVRVPSPNDGTKPTVGSKMMGPYAEFIAHFWPMWEGAGTSLADIGIGTAATIIGPNTGWGAASRGIGLIAPFSVIGTDDISVPQLIISNGFSLERLFKQAGAWVHEVIVSDPDEDISTRYLNGIAVSTAAYNPTVSINSLLVWDGNGTMPTAPMGLEFARIWDRALTSYEVVDLCNNPYQMFGVTQAVLDEITTIVNFMKPMRTSYNFVIE